MKRHHLVAMIFAVAVALVGCGSVERPSRGHGRHAGGDGSTASRADFVASNLRRHRRRRSSTDITPIAITISRSRSSGSVTRPIIFRNWPTMRSTMGASRNATREIWPRRLQVSEKLIRTYPESVTIADAEVALSDIYLRLTRASDAAARLQSYRENCGRQNRTIGDGSRWRARRSRPRQFARRLQ